MVVPSRRLSDRAGLTSVSFFQKRKIHAYAEQAGVPYTSIIVGFWNQLSFPPKEPPEQLTPFQKSLLGYYGTGNVKTTLVNRLNLGRFVPSILKDERTIQKRVLAHEDEVTPDHMWEWADKYSGRKISENKNVVCCWSLLLSSYGLADIFTGHCGGSREDAQGKLGEPPLGIHQLSLCPWR